MNCGTAIESSSRVRLLRIKKTGGKKYEENNVCFDAAGWDAGAWTD